MSPDGQKILAFLSAVAVEREKQSKDAARAQKVRAVKAYQHRRFAGTYSDLLADVRYGPAAKFFLDDLYGPSDFTERDDQFARIVPALVRLFPAEIVQTVAALAELHALSERLDSQMAEHLSGVTVDEVTYARAWRDVGQAAARESQIELMLRVGSALDRLTRKPLLRHSLKLMRGPAAAAGLGTLQRFLERGFDTFRGMRGADGFLGTIATRERKLAAELFDGPSSATVP